MYQYRQIKDGLKYLSDKTSEGFVVKKGEYLQLEYESVENTIKNKIDTEVASLKAEFDDSIEKALDAYCYFGKKDPNFIFGIEPISLTPINASKNSEGTRHGKEENMEHRNHTEEDILLEVDNTIINRYSP